MSDIRIKPCELFEQRIQLLSTRARYIVNSYCNSYEDFMTFCSKDLNIRRIPNCGFNTYKELIQLYKDLESITPKNDSLNDTKKKSEIELLFEQKIFSLSNRAQRFIMLKCETYSSFMQIMRNSKSSASLMYVGPVTYNELQTLYNELVDIRREQISNEITYPLYSIISEIATKYGINFEDSDLKNISRYYENKKHLPLFLLLNIYLVQSSLTAHVIFVEWLNNFHNVNIINLLSSKYGISKGRIMQITSRGQLFLTKLDFVKDTIDFYPFIKEPYISYDSSHFEKLSQEEFISINFHQFIAETISLNKYYFFAFTEKDGLVHPLLKYRIASEASKVFLCACSENLAKFKFSVVLLSICSEYNRYNKIRTICINKYILNPKYWQNGIIRPYQGLSRLISEILKYLLNYEIVNGVIKKNIDKLSLCKICEKVLSASKVPLKLSEIQKRIKIMYPTYSYVNDISIDRIRIAMNNRRKFQSLGKRSTYALKGVHRYIKGSLDDVLLQILINKNEALNVSQIETLCAQLGVYTTRRSITTTLGKLKKEGLIYSFQRGMFELNSQKKLDRRSRKN